VVIFRVFWKLVVQPFFQIIEDGFGIGLSQDKPIFGARALFFPRHTVLLSVWWLPR